MNVAKLREELARRNVDEARFRIMEPPGDSTMCIRKQGKVWLVYYFERGSKWDLKRFGDEDLACRYFLDQLVG